MKRIILPNYLFEELKDLPDNELSFRQHVYRILNGKYTGLGSVVEPFVGSVKHDLTMNINATLAILQDEIQYAIEEGIGDCTDWTAVNPHAKLLRIVALASGRIFVGRPLSRDEEWIKLTVNYTIDSANAVKDVFRVPWWLRPFVVRYLPSIRKAIGYRHRVAEKLKPQLSAMIEASKLAQDLDDDAFFDVTPSDQHCMATWSLVSAPSVIACSLLETEAAI